MSKPSKNMIYSKLFGNLINSRWKLDDTMISFLYYLFPRDLFVRALSLLDSGDMFIYLLESGPEEQVCEEAAVVHTGEDGTTHEQERSDDNGLENQQTRETLDSSNYQTFLEEFSRKLYDPGQSIPKRLIVKSNEDTDVPIYVDLGTWICSCGEYTERFQEAMTAGPSDASSQETNSKLSSILLTIKDDSSKFSDDKFAQIDAHSLSSQYYIDHSKLICPHLLAYSILLSSSQRTFRYFAIRNPTVLLIKITNLDEWLRLHINIVS
ncbi:hypothetical protein TPHA_0D04360 [Tetrapisispora phaffii CBS 4417]|uniref:Uncharacterized protein n=1 Tax=Tetrapisispora phaffii (strain ATCC 24235 / CBS 4417 / NBRC 1672 / NRRL Y-8282 / UCD 70-5) TaxID=1071381 RepID=G8BRZ5_TETPH|nr:hypothetical protein TPHA_0D04360 [Tetrapisispora phaffii CBS 4417]CCE63070.1 hypothetical protein TPHA_0D04360 [Tetrapisispora phaffii CBS 4417]